MSANEMRLLVNERSYFVSNKLLGIFGIIGAPTLLFEMLIRAMMSEPEKLDERVAGWLGIFYIGSWIASAVGIQRLKATGDGLAKTIVFTAQIIGLILAFLFSAQEIFGVNYQTGGLFFTVTDIAYPFSHVFMIVVGILVWRAGVWKGLARFAPLLIGISLPLFFPLMSLVGMKLSSIGFTGLNTIGFVLIAAAVYNSQTKLSFNKNSTVN
jgi:hypothetical protein